MGKAYLDIQGTPGLVSTGTDSLTVGAAGTGMLKLLAAGGAHIVSSSPAEGTAAATVATGGTITPSTLWHRITNAGAITGVILAAGSVHGQLLILSVDKDAVGTTTFAAAGTSRVSTGTGCVLSIGGGAIFVWDATDAIWTQIAEA